MSVYVFVSVGCIDCGGLVSGLFIPSSVLYRFEVIVLVLVCSCFVSWCAWSSCVLRLLCTPVWRFSIQGL